MSVHYLETGSTDPCYNLALEQYILEHKREGDWLLLWQNANTIVIGLNQNTAEEINSDFVSQHGITVVRRMTGGGAVYHDLGNLNYSFISDVGNTEALTIRRFTDPVCRALAAMGVSAETSGRNDILVDGKKISGVAQRIAGNRILHHGTLLFDSNPDMISGALRVDPAKFSSKSAKSVRSRVGNIREHLPEDMTLDRFWQCILDELTVDGIVLEQLTESELAEIRKLADEKYRNWEWNYGRSPDCTYQNRRRFPGGTLEVRLSLHAGRIEEIIFYGDYMATSPQTALTEALCGIRCDEESLSEVLSCFDLRSLFGGITRDEILSLILDSDPGAPSPVPV